jgi:cytochrome oxidase Cu insertion factor (SCO1/SenC/PrrC family)
MSGMGGSLSANNPLVVAAFHRALLHQAVVVAVLLALMFIAWSVGWLRADAAGVPAAPEHPARRVLRIGFGLIWVLDGLLQLQSAMPLGMPSQVVTPAASSSPAWVRHLVADGVRIWVRHPVPAAASAVWIQLGIGLFLLFAPRGLWSRTAGLVSVGWGLVVWVFGEAFGGIFAPGLSWLFGAPGAVLFYALAGALLVLPDRAWSGRRLGRLLLAGMGLFFVGMAVLQAWPGRGFWQGQARPSETAGAVTAMAQAMSTTSQPHALSSAVSSFGSFDAAHGWGVNLFVVVMLAVLGAVFLSGRVRLVRVGVAAGAVFCLAVWVLVQDMAFFGGVGTDPNSMIPMSLVFVAGYLALRGVRVPATADAAAVVPADQAFPDAPVPASAPPAAVPEPAMSQSAGPESAVPEPGVPQSAGPPSAVRQPAAAGWRARLSPSTLLGAVVAAGAFGVVLVGAIPMAAATANPHPDTILTEALNGSPLLENAAAPAFSLVDQAGRPVSLAGLRGKTIALTFLDPVCTSDCPIIAQQFHQADSQLGAAASHTVFIAVVANPLYRSLSYVRSFDSQERLTGVRNWLFLTGSVRALRTIWNDYGIQVQTEGDGSMVAHSEQAYIIDGAGRLRAVLGTDPGSSSVVSASLATLIATEMRSVL